MTDTPRTVEALAEAVESELEPSYTLVWIARGDSLTDEECAALVRGDEEALWQSRAEWEADCQWDAACDAADEIAERILREWGDEDCDLPTDDAVRCVDVESEWRGSSERAEIIDLIRERDTSEWLSDLVRETSSVLIRVQASEEGDYGYDEEIDPAAMLSDLGMDASEPNVSALRHALSNAGTGVYIAFWIASVDVGEVFALPYDCPSVTLTDPYLWVGNPFTGAGWMTESPISGMVTLPRASLRTDRDAWGYSMDEIHGGIHLDYLSPLGYPCVKRTARMTGEPICERCGSDCDCLICVSSRVTA